MRKLFIVTLVLLASISSNAQLDSLGYALSNGKVSGYSRTFFMATDNAKPYKDWYALATGGLLKYETQSYKGFQLGAGFYYSHYIAGNVFELDTFTNKPSRYELGLFDVNDRKNKEIPMLGEAFVKYKKQNHEFTLGRFKLKSPFLNPEDGRMIPTLEQGLWYKYDNKKNLSGQLGWLTHIGARSTSEFLTVAESIGSYPTGKNPDGTNSGYKGNLSSKGLGVANIKYTTKSFEVDFWDYYTENIYNSVFIQPTVKIGEENIKHQVSAQWLYQSKLNDGGNTYQSLTYFSHNKSQVFGAKYQISPNPKWTFSANWNYVTDEGRYLFPREWGREFLFTFQKRERLEGVSNSHAFMIDVKKVHKLNNEGKIIAILGYGQYLRPDAKDFDNNKYAMPANHQLNFDLMYKPKDKGLNIEWLTTYKKSIGNTYNNANFIINKVEMINHNLVVNYVF